MWSHPVDKKAVLKALEPVMDPGSKRSIIDGDTIARLEVSDGGKVTVALRLSVPSSQAGRVVRAAVNRALGALDGVTGVDCQVEFVTLEGRPAPVTDELKPASVKRLIMVYSGKGGVGKSSVCVNLALAMRQLGYRVGLLDADVHGPSIPIMLTPTTTAALKDKRLVPIEANGLFTMSVGYLIDPEEAAMWRGAMLSGALTQLLQDTDWPELDFLFMDLPPGTGDIQMTIGQRVSADGAILVTTPQDVALADAARGKVMFDRFGIETLGIIENMSGYTCPKCGKVHAIFGEGGGVRASVALKAPLWAEIPIIEPIRAGADSGHPMVETLPDSPAGKLFRELAQTIAARVQAAPPVRSPAEEAAAP